MAEDVKEVEKQMADVIKERFSEIFEPRAYLTDEVVRGDLPLYISAKKQTVEELTKRYNESHDVPVSRQRISSILNELAAEDKKILIWYQGSEKYVCKSLLGERETEGVRLAPIPGTPIVPNMFEDEDKYPRTPYERHRQRVREEGKLQKEE